MVTKQNRYSVIFKIKFNITASTKKNAEAIASSRFKTKMPRELTTVITVTRKLNKAEVK